MLVFPSFLFLIALLSHPHYHAAANHPLFPRARTALMPAKRIDGLLGVTARQFFCDPGYGVCGNGCCSGSCCTSTGTCCPYAPGTADCCPGGGCCALGSYCDGKGCCPIGEVCSGGGGYNHHWRRRWTTAAQDHNAQAAPHHYPQSIAPAPAYHSYPQGDRSTSAYQ
ncbi:hypothetical protein B0H16DRAFT_1585068 [Mycena metata]|uniref:Granulins domain-containing protein n=1 Tax=Mycena metata TaxID=1033252 RepID=A0AAD7MS90_9AGAR|nr:hypothetical protein B0H16DRAFT_1585068 [Mycena metata]